MRLGCNSGAWISNESIRKATMAARRYSQSARLSARPDLGTALRTRRYKQEFGTLTAAGHPGGYDKASTMLGATALSRHTPPLTTVCQ